MTKRIMAVALVAVSLLAAHTVQAEDVTLVRIVPIGSIPTDTDWCLGGIRIIVIGRPQGQTLTFPTVCTALSGITLDSVEAVVLTIGVAAQHLTMYVLSATVQLSPGDRLASISSDTSQCCVKPEFAVTSCSDPLATDNIHKLVAQRTASASAGATLYTSPVALNVDALGVVTGQPNDDGTHTVIFKTQGSPAQQVDIASFDELFPADVLRELIDLGQDPETGQHLYLAFIEW